MIRDKRFVLPKNLALKAVIVVLTAAAAAVMYVFDVGCVFLGLTGLPCPGCGITRATAALLSGRFGDVFSYYPAYGALPVLFLYFLYDGELFSEKRLNRTVLLLSVAVIAVFYIIRTTKILL